MLRAAERRRQEEEILLSICEQHTRLAPPEVVFSEPYLPRIPPRWNSVLVLAEAQNLGRQSAAYREALAAKSPRERMVRLAGKGEAGIQPWDDGSIKLAIAAALVCEPEETAVSNVVPWSRVDTDDNNATPSDPMIERAISFWKDLLPRTGPETIITCGKVAARVITAADDEVGRRFVLHKWRLPSPSAMSRVSGMFSEADLLERYPEVAEVCSRHPEWADRPHRRNKIFFACHAVSTTARG